MAILLHILNLGEDGIFNSCNEGYAERKVPPLINFTDVYPVCIFYIKNEENNKDSEDCIIF